MSQRLAEVLRDQARTQTRRGRNVLMGEVVGLTPLTVRLLSQSLTLDDDDFELSAWASAYDAEFGIEEEDTVLLLRESGEWTIFDVLPEKTPKFGKADTDKRLDELEDRVKALEEA